MTHYNRIGYTLLACVGTFCGTLLLTMIFGFYIDSVKAQEFTFHPEIRPISFDFSPHDYKETRANEICEIAKDKGFTDNECKLLVAQIYTENGAMAEDRDGDHGCSLGTIQWNFCVHEGMKARAWVKLHPEWGEWRYQVSFYLDQMNQRKEHYGSLKVAQESWNFGGRPWYYQKITSNVALASSWLK